MARQSCYLMRHATADCQPVDFERRLTIGGEEEAAQAAEALLGFKTPHPTKVVYIPLVRARESAEIVVSVAEGQGFAWPAEVRSSLKPEDNPLTTLAWLEGLAPEEGPFLVVGHNPHLQIVLEHLLLEQTTPFSSLRVRKASVWYLTRKEGERPWRLEACWSP